MKKKLKSLVLSAMVALALTGIQSCGVTPVDQTKLDGYWVLTELNGQRAEDLFKGSIPSIEFNRTDTLISGNAGCNSYFGKYTISKENAFSAPAIGATRKLCIFENKEPEYLKALGENTVIGFDQAGNLTFTKDKTVILSFAKGEVPDPVETPVAPENEQDSTAKRTVVTL